MAWENNRPTHVPKKAREAALNRDRHQCTATLHTGQRCTETERLEADEITRWYPGKTVTVDDLQTLCHWHHAKRTHQQAMAERGKGRGPSTTHPHETHPAFR